MRYLLAFLLFAPASTFAASPDAEAAAAFAFAKAARERAKPVVTATRGYPLRPASTWWSGCPNWQHMTQGEHARQFPADWLAKLSWAELQSLHSDAHEGKVDWNAIYMRDVETARPAAVTYSLPASTSSCPGGNCPQSAGYTPLLRWRR